VSIVDVLLIQAAKSVPPSITPYSKTMSKQASPPREQPEQPAFLSAGLRSGVTLLLIVHLFAVAVGVLGYAFPLSPLRSQLADVPFVRPYLQTLHMDTAYNFHLTDGLEVDLDHSVLIEQQGAVPAPDVKANMKIRLPEPSMQPGIRRERFQQLAQQTAIGGEGDPVRPLLSKTIGGALLKRVGAVDGTYQLRVERQTVLSREDVDSPQIAQSNPYDPSRFATAYEGAIILDGSSVYFSEIAPESQRAGLRDQAAAGDGRP
jgi:hypothetical protein